MESLYLLIPIALVFVAIAVRVLLWAINSGQYDNLDTEAHRILFDDDEPITPRREAAADTPADALPEHSQQPEQDNVGSDLKGEHDV